MAANQLQRSLMTEIKTFTQWAAEGRTVKKGEKAKHYIVAPDWSTAQAAFSEDQTEEIVPIHTRIEDNWQLVPAAEWKRHKQQLKTKSKKPRVLVDFNTETQETVVWCGSDKVAIGSLRKGGYEFDIKSHKWSHPAKDPWEVVKGFEEYGYSVGVGDGIPIRMEL